MAEMNAGYRAGLLVRRFRSWVVQMEEKAIRQGLSHRTARTLTVLFIAAVAGLIIVYAPLIAFFIALIVLIASLIASTPYSSDDEDKQTSGSPFTQSHRPPREGFHTNGPDGIGTYVGGRKVSDDDEGLIRPDDD